MAALARMQGDLARAAELATRNLEISRPLGIKREVALGLGTLGWIALHRGELSRATELFEEGLAINRELGALPRVARNLRGLGVTAFRQGDLSRARRLAVESVRLSEKIGSKADVVETISSLCGLLIAASDPPSAARWLGFTHAARDTGMLVTFGVDRADVDRLTETVRERLGDTAFDRAWNEGRLLSTEQVIREIESSFAEMAAAASTKEPYPLSPREREVAALIAEGLSNANIAARLHIGVRTAETHVQSIMNKLALHSRAQIATWVSKRLSH
jgi:DNA-binding CsgD family transcriptional regulator